MFYYVRKNQSANLFSYANIDTKQLHACKVFINFFFFFQNLTTALQLLRHIVTSYNYLFSANSHACYVII